MYSKNLTESYYTEIVVWDALNIYYHFKLIKLLDLVIHNVVASGD